MPSMIFYLKEDLFDKVKLEPKRSELLDKLLREHYDMQDIKLWPTEKIEAEMKVIEIKEEAERRIQEVRNGGMAKGNESSGD